ncbi:MAG: hypothetical protein PF542_04955 [Nanoarchaeota archaeon]|jgi:hypothetical protein|nr:hypothetical protein [Nanoarchaeota archaeon]
MTAKRQSVDDVLKKYGAKIESQVRTADSENVHYSQSYEKFKSEMVTDYNGYEKLCHTLGSFIKIKPTKADEDKVRKYLETAHLDVEPWQAIGLGVVSMLVIFFIGLFGSVAVALIDGFENFPVLFFMLALMFSVFVFSFAQGYPERLSKKWLLKASSQMVPALLYIVVYMRHTPNLERAIQFASEHLDPPLALDFGKIFYNVEVGKYSTIKESLDAYLETWRGTSTEFIEGFHLIESSLFEPEEGRRISTLEKALQVVLDGVYDKMLKFSHNVKAPLTNVYMLGVVLPTLGLALIPLASAMVGGALSATMIFVGFNLLIPFFVFFLTDKVLIMRPGGHGATDLLERNPLYYKYTSKAPYKKAFLLVLPLILLSIIPVLWGYTPLAETLGLHQDYTMKELGLGIFGENELFFHFAEMTGDRVDKILTYEQRRVAQNMKGPFGLGALVLGMLLPLAISMFFVISYKARTKEMIKEREKTQELEKEFNNSLFQLGNRLGNGVPPELVFSRVAKSTKGLRTGEFFSQVNYNIRSLGMSVDDAIFDKKRGAIKFYPSEMIATSMRVLVESSKKGLKIAAISLMSISEYVKNINKITLRLKDLLAEVTGDMKSNMTFLAPLLSGIVVGLGAMITSILSKMDPAAMGGDAAGSGVGGFSQLISIFNYGGMIPPYFLQIAVGIYLVQIIFILTGSLVIIDAGEDKLKQTYDTALNLKSGVGLYFTVALIAVLVLSLLAGKVLGGMMG